MKRTIKGLFLALFLTLGLGACQDPIEEPQSAIEIEQSVVVTASGGTTSIKYTLTNPVEGAELVAENPSAEWLHDLAVTPKAVTFVADANISLEATDREATFELNYNAQRLATVTVSQTTTTGTLTVEIQRVTPETVDFVITSTNENLTYLVNVAPKSYIEELGGLEEYALVEAEVFRGSYYGDLLDEYLLSGNTTKTITVAGAPEEPMWLWVAGVVRAGDEIRTPMLAAEPVYEEFQFLPYPILSLQSYSAHLETTEAGTFSLRYAVDNPFEGATLKVEIADDGASWVSNVVIDEKNRTISFDYDENPYPIDRKATIYVSYDYSEICEFVLTQVESIVMENIDFDITVKEVHYDRAVVDCVPSDLEATYALGAIAKKDFESYAYGSDPTKIPEFDLVNKYPTHLIFSGAQSGVTLSNAAISYDTDWYIYAYAVNGAQTAAISEVTMVPVTLVEDRPYFVWDDPRVVATEYSNTLSVDNTKQTITVKYSVENSHPDMVVVVEEPYDDILIKTDGKRVLHDAEAQTVTFTVSANDTKRARTTYVYLKYFANAEDTTSDANTSLKISQSK